MKLYLDFKNKIKNINRELKMKQITFFFMVILTVMMISGKSFGNSYSITSNTNWSAINGGKLPTSGDDVIIQNGATVTVDINNAACSNLTIGSKGNGTLVFNDGSILSVSGNLTLGDNNNTGSFIMTNGGTLMVKGNFTVNNIGNWTPGNGTIVYNGSSQTVYSNKYNNLTISGNDKLSIKSSVTVNGIFSIEGTASVSGAPTYGNSATLQYNTSSPRTVGSEWPSTFNKPVGIIIANTGAITLNENKTLYGSAQLTINSGATLNCGNYSLDLNGNFINNGTLNSPTGTVIFSGTSAQTIGGTSTTTFYKLTINNSNGVSLGNSVVVTNTLTLTSGILNTGNNSITFSGNAANPIETTNNRIVGTAVMASRSLGTASLNFLNAYLHSGSDVGTITITRVTGSAVTIGSYSGINSYWNITTTNTSATRDIDYSWLSVYDNNHAFSSNNKAQIYKSTDGGSIWVNVGTPSDVSGSNPRTITITNVLPSMKWTVSSGDAPLPVQLASLTSSITGRNVSLKWSTSQEINNSGFEIERKNNGGDFVKVGFVMGKGTVSTTTNYEFSDRNLASGNYSYRLKQIDNNGNFEYFSLNGDVTIGIPTKFDLSQNYPNPFNPTTKVNFDLPKDGMVSLKVYDMSGREVATMVNGFRTAGFYTIDFNAANLSSGVYFYRISAGEFSAVKKMTLIK